MYIPQFFRRFLALTLALSLPISCQRLRAPDDNAFQGNESISSEPTGSEQETQIATPPSFPPEQSAPEPSASPPKEQINGAFWDVTDVDVSYIDPNKKLLSFTFDDAPGKTLENLLGVFASYNQSSPSCKATATLFCNGIRITPSSKQLLSAAYTLGFELGNHSQTHTDLTVLSISDLKWETDATDALLYKIDGKARHLFRAPFGKLNETVRSYAHTPIIDWTIDTLDWTGVSEEEIYRRVWEQKFDGGIVLMHDGYPNTVQAVKRLLPDLRQAGYQVVCVSAMAKAHECPLRRGGVYIRARKNGVA